MPTPEQQADKLLAEIANDLRPFVEDFILNRRYGHLGIDVTFAAGDATDTETFAKPKRRLNKPTSPLAANR